MGGVVARKVWEEGVTRFPVESGGIESGLGYGCARGVSVSGPGHEFA